MNTPFVTESAFASPLPILPVRNTVLFPLMSLPLSIGREKSMLLLRSVLNDNSLLGVVAQIDSEKDLPGESDLFRTGTLGKVVKASDMDKDTASILVQGIARFRIKRLSTDEPFHLAEVEYFPEVNSFEGDLELEASYRNLKQIVLRVIRLSPNIPDEATGLVEKVASPAYLCDMVTHYLDLDVKDKQAILDLTEIHARVLRVTEILTRELEVLELGNKIQTQVRDRLEHNQREAYLREQLRAIQQELGETESGNEDLETLRTQIKEAEMPEEALEACEKELKRLSRMHSSSPEYQVGRNYLEWMLDLPWSKSTADNLDIDAAEKILNEDHYGLDKVKRRILEYLAVRKLKNDLKGPILCFQGPPGVGKTSLGKSIARALGRNFYRLSLGGVHDEAEIRGHRRTYIGAMPGRIVKGLKKAGSNNPVFMLDEIEKLGHDFRGDPSSALLEVLDPEQNIAFSDHYIEVPVDLRGVMFITTANMLDTIPPALLDRMEVINIPGYSEEEKLHIATRYLIPQTIEEHGLNEEQIRFEEEAIRLLINNYTKESGVRTLRRELAAVARAVARDVSVGAAKRRNVTAAEVERILGKRKYWADVAERVAHTGVATGLAWTPTGGDILFIEATQMKGKGNLTLTGQLGDVMKESAQAALSYIRANATDLAIDEDLFANHDLHLHVPAGAIPKDGPSAGVTMLTALTSLLLKKPVRNDVAMTGEITLRGAVLPVGGIKEKLLAAKRAGIRTVILPDKNEKDVEEISESARADMEFLYVDNMRAVLKHALDITPLRPT